MKKTSDRRGKVKVSGSIRGDKSIEIYSRLDKVEIGGIETIGDIQVSYQDMGDPKFSLEAKNLVINRRPFWDICIEGKFSPEKKKITFDDAKWGEGFVLEGDISTRDPFRSALRLTIKNVDLEELTKNFVEPKERIEGTLRGEIEVSGPISTAEVKGRAFIGEGVSGNMIYRSFFATLSGNLPIIKITDSRIVQEGGNIIVTGEVDFSKFRKDKVMEGVIYDTDNKVAVWEGWQISKDGRSETVEARKDRLIVSTAFEDGINADKQRREEAMRKELGFAYELDDSNRIKMEFDEGKDFLGLEHKMDF